MKKTTKAILKVGTLSALAYGANRLVHYMATKNNLLAEQELLTYDWTHGKIKYRKAGKGSPIILLHDISYYGNSFEYHFAIPKLARGHAVYALDFLGCGQSEKPKMEYTNFLYVQMLCSFIQDIIGKKVSIVASGLSASAAIMAQRYQPDLFDQIILTNPSDIYEVPGNKQLEKFMAMGLEFPLFGTLAYNLLTTRKQVTKALKNGFYNKKNCNSSIIDRFFESAHLGDADAKYIYLSIIGNYMAANMIPALEEMDNLTILIGEEKERGIEIASHYKRFVGHIHVYKISKTKDYPQLEAPDTFAETIKHALAKSEDL